MRRRKSNHKQHGFLVIALAVILLTAGVWHFVGLLRADPLPIQNDVTVTATVLGCGDGIIQLGEDCDGANLNSHTCVTEGFVSGAISCTPSCTLNTSSCSSSPASSGGVTPLNPPKSDVLLSGKAYLGSIVYVLQDGQTTKTVTADVNGNFETRLTNVASGNYTFGIYAEDADGVYRLVNYSALSTYPLNIGLGSSAQITDIFVAPILAVEKDSVIQGETEKLYGKSAPNANVTITVNLPAGIQAASSGLTLATVNPPTINLDTTADSGGNFSYDLATDKLPLGSFGATAVASLQNSQSNRSLPADFAVSNVPVVQYLPGDYNENQRVNLVDFSIALYWYKEQLSDAFKILEIRHGNGDGLLNLIDISIIAYWWTG